MPRRTVKPKLFTFIWHGSVNDDWTAGDVIVIAKDVFSARLLIRERMDAYYANALPTGGYGENQDRPHWAGVLHSGVESSVYTQPPDVKIPVTEGLLYFGPGGS